MPRYRAVVFDLFGTLVHFRGRPDPRCEWLRAPFAAVADPARFDAFRAALQEVSMDILAGRGAEHREVPSRERFARALARSGLNAAAADALSAAHMRHLASCTAMPVAHADLLARLAVRHRLAVVSNFDHGPTARAVLSQHGIAHHFAAVLISADFGRRKPHPAIFHEALRRLDVAPAEALHVGDTHAEDVMGAHAAGLDVAWLAPADGRGDPPATHRIRELAALPALLAIDA
jgi:putative hydrolase of the HAD superfamily